MFHFWQLRPCSCILLQIKEQYCAIIIKRHRMLVTIGIEINCYQTKHCCLHSCSILLFKQLSNFVIRTIIYHKFSQIFHISYIISTLTLTLTEGHVLENSLLGSSCIYPLKIKNIVLYCIVHFNKLVTLCQKVRCGIQFLIHLLIMRVFT